MVISEKSKEDAQVIKDIENSISNTIGDMVWRG
jgi:hypothetical protein